MEFIYTIILNFNNFQDTCECVDSLINISPSKKLSNRIILVDNHSTDKSCERLKERYNNNIDIVILQSGKNLGYAGGNNLGIKYALSHKADYICILNNDTVIEKNFYEQCIEHLKSSDSVAFVSPVIEEYHVNLVQSTGGDINFNTGQVTVKNSGSKLECLKPVIECDYVGGACMVFHSSLIQDIGLIPENYFLFFEETEWCYRAIKKGFNNQCISAVSIRHKGSASINTIIGLHSYLMERNRIVFLKRNTPSKCIFVKALSFLFVKYIKWGITRDKRYFNYLLYMKDGLLNKVDYKKYPFIVLND